MCVFVCVWECMCVRVFFVCECVFVGKLVCLIRFICVRLFVYVLNVYVCVCECECVCLFWCVYINIYVCLWMYLFVCFCVFLFVLVWEYLCVYVCIYLCMRENEKVRVLLCVCNMWSCVCVLAYVHLYKNQQTKQQTNKIQTFMHTQILQSTYKLMHSKTFFHTLYIHTK